MSQRPLRPGERFRLGHEPVLDGLRGLAIVAVVLFHWRAPWAPGGFLGVDLFFVLSGFLITALLQQEVEATGRVDLRNFYVRRTLRLLPALLVLLGAYALFLVRDAASPRADGRWAAIGAVLLYVGNWKWALSPASEDALGPLTHTWSLGVEEQFYLAWPLLLAALVAWRARRGSVVAVLVLGILGSAAWRNVLRLDGASDVRLYAGTDTRIGALLIGCLLATWLRQQPSEPDRREARRADALGLVALGTALVLLWSARIHEPWQYCWGEEAVAAVAAMLVYGAMRGTGRLRSLLSWAPLRWVGVRSYGIYLWHYPVVVAGERMGLLPAGGAVALGGAVMLGTLTLAIAATSYELIERPALAWRQRFAARPTERPSGAD